MGLEPIHVQHKMRPGATINARRGRIEGKSRMKYLRVQDQLENFAEPGSLSDAA